MALTFKTDALLGLITTTISGITDADDAYKLACTEARHQYREDWWNDNVRLVRSLRDHLTQCLRNDRPPTTDDARAIMQDTDCFRSSGVRFFDGGGDGGVSKPKVAYYSVEGLESLAVLLRAHTLETVTAHQLKELGIHPRDLERLFRAAVSTGAAVSA